MISDADFRGLLDQKAETRNLDYKESLNWDNANNDAKCELIKDILALLNTQDGGSIVLGVQDGTMAAIGLKDRDFQSFDTTKVNDFLRRYTDPPSSCEVQKRTLGGKQFVLINVPQFTELPILCKKAANSTDNSSKTILKAGGLYIRTDKATSELVSNAEEMRDLMNRALLKRGDQLLSMIRGLLTGGTQQRQPEQDMQRYAKEIEDAQAFFSKVLPNDFEKHGHWRVTAMPQTYTQNRIPNISGVGKALGEAEVSLRGWNFPHQDRETRSNFANGQQSYTTFMHHVEAHRAYQSGLFTWRSWYWENFSDFAKQHSRALSFVNVIYTVTEFLVFLKRYYERISPESSIQFSLEMTHLEDRRLVATDFDSFPFLGNYVARVPVLEIERDFSVSELRASAEETAIAIVQKIFEVFNWNNPDANMIRGWQQRLLSRTL